MPARGNASATEHMTSVRAFRKERVWLLKYVFFQVESDVVQFQALYELDLNKIERRYGVGTTMVTA